MVESMVRKDSEWKPNDWAKKKMAKEFEQITQKREHLDHWKSKPNT
jgi:hypothetical protein